LGELDFLLAVDDECRVGALRFRDEDGNLQGGAEGRRTPPLIELRQMMASSQAVEMCRETEQDLQYLLGRGTSLGGLRPKCSVRDDDGQLAIGKFPSVSDERAVTKGEVLALCLAKRAGIQTPPARIVHCEGQAVAVIRRFDRRPDGSRIPYVSAATLLGVERNSPLDHAYTDIVDAIRIHGFRAREDIEELYRRIALSIAINNVDDHLHNHGFLHVGHGQWQLSPAFDINPFPDRIRELKTWISPELGPEASWESLLVVAPYFGLDSTDAHRTIEKVQHVVKNWRSVAQELGLTTNESDSLAPAFKDD